ncbi:hypothetical protein QAD02_009720 [Eretmocerus hayati]|uniref:Uncharacterized protein n=1 Tax=Eretmocerus hayati TaxID=131215 RepID=A0ACC2NA66_9HYME|nr:hypothetical protein QAD02_009720 [Eretmocerus hayati]
MIQELGDCSAHIEILFQQAINEHSHASCASLEDVTETSLEHIQKLLEELPPRLPVFRHRLIQQLTKRAPNAPPQPATAAGSSTLPRPILPLLPLREPSPVVKRRSCDNMIKDQWEGTILQVQHITKTLARSYQPKLMTFGVYCTYWNNPTQLERPADDEFLTPYEITEQECLDA